MYVHKANKIISNDFQKNAVSGTVPHHSRHKFLHGVAINIPLPIHDTLSKLKERAKQSGENNNVVVYGPIKFNKVLRTLVDTKKVFTALSWLVKNNPLYKNIVLPDSAEEMFPTDESDCNNVEKSSWNNPVIIDDLTDINTNGEHEHIKKLNITDLEKYEQVTLQGVIPDTIPDFADNLYEQLQLNTKPISDSEEQLELYCFPEIFPFGKGGFSENRQKRLYRAYYEKARLLSSFTFIRRHIEYIFHLYQQREKRAVNQGVYSTLNTITSLKDLSAKELLEKIKNNDKVLERHVTRAIAKHPNTKPYWNSVKMKLKAMTDTFGPPTFFLTLSTAEYDWEDLENFLLEVNPDFRNKGFSLGTLISKDPVTATIFIRQRFQAVLRFILSDAQPLGKVTHHYIRTEYQSRGLPHFHCLFWVDGAPTLTKS